MSMQVIIVVIILLVVLVVLLFIFKDQISNAAKSFGIIRDNTQAGVEGTRCASILGNRVCAENQPSDEYQQVFPSNSTRSFDDCKGGKLLCWEKK